MAATPPDYLRANVEAWDARQADQLRVARRQWSRTEPAWGVFGIPEQVARVLPASLDGTTAVELGCGTAYVSAWLACRGAQPVAVDPTPGQLRIAQRVATRHGLDGKSAVMLARPSLPANRLGNEQDQRVAAIAAPGLTSPALYRATTHCLRLRGGSYPWMMNPVRT